MSISKPQDGDKGKKAATAEDLPFTKKRTRSSQAIQDPPLMADAMKGYNPSSQLKEIAEDSEAIGQYKRVKCLILQLSFKSKLDQLKILFSHSNSNNLY